MRLLVRTSQTLMARSWPPAAIDVPSGEKATLRRAWWFWSSYEWMHLRVSTSHTRTVLSSPHDTARRPSGANCALRTQLRCPVKEALKRCEGRLHILTVLSSDAVRRKRPSAAKDTERTAALWACDRGGAERAGGALAGRAGAVRGGKRAPAGSLGLREGRGGAP